MGMVRGRQPGFQDPLNKGVILCLSVFLFFQCVGFSHADNAEVMPKGVFGVNVEGKFYFPITQRFDPNGNSEDLAVDLNGVLDSNVFPGLQLVEDVFGLPRGSANIGTSRVSFEFNYTVVEFHVFYGITDQLSFGIKIPYWDVSNDVDAQLDTSRATIGKSRLLNTLVPLGFLDSVPLTTKDAQNLIGKGLDINGDGKIDIKGFGFKPVKDFSDNGLSDIEAGFKYQYLNTKDWRLAATVAGHFPTGEVDDPDSLVDTGFGTGAWGVFFFLNHDYVGIKDLVLDGTFRYKLFLPYDRTFRVPSDVNEPLTPFKSTVDLDLGDVFELETSASYTLLEGLSLGLLYRYAFSLRDQVSGPAGTNLNFTTLEEETQMQEHVGIVSLSYSTLPLFLAKKFPLPLTAAISYRNRFAGSDNVYKSEYISFSLGVYF